MANVRLTWNGNSLDLARGRDALVVNFKEKRFQRQSGSGKTEHLSLYGLQEISVSVRITEDQWRDFVAWWSYVRRGNTWSFAYDSSKTAATTLDGSAAAAQKVVPLTSTSGFSVGDVCLIRAEDQDDDYELIKIASKSPGVSITAEDDLYYSYTSGDTFRHQHYWDSVVCTNDRLDARQQDNDDYLFTIRFVENL